MSEWIDNKNTNIWSHVFEVKSHFWFLLLFTSLQTTLLLTVHSLWFHPRLSLSDAQKCSASRDVGFSDPAVTLTAEHGVCVASFCQSQTDRRVCALFGV